MKIKEYRKNEIQLIFKLRCQVARLKMNVKVLHDTYQSEVLRKRNIKVDEIPDNEKNHEWKYKRKVQNFTKIWKSMKNLQITSKWIYLSKWFKCTQEGPRWRIYIIFSVVMCFLSGNILLLFWLFLALSSTVSSGWTDLYDFCIETGPIF